MQLFHCFFFCFFVVWFLVPLCVFASPGFCSITVLLSFFHTSQSNALQSLRRRPYTPCHPQSSFSWAIPLTVGCCSSCWWALLRFMVPCLSTYVPSIFVQSGLINWCHYHAPSQNYMFTEFQDMWFCPLKQVASVEHSPLSTACHTRGSFTTIVTWGLPGMAWLQTWQMDGLESYCCWSPSLADELGSRHNGACNRGLHREWSSGKHTPSWDPSVASRHVSP